MGGFDKQIFDADEQVSDGGQSAPPRPTKMPQALLKNRLPPSALWTAGEKRHDHADPPPAPAVLRPPRERPRRSDAAEQRDELAPFHVEHGDFLPYALSAPLTGPCA